MTRNERTQMGGACGQFLTTHWSVIEGVQGAGQDQRILLDLLSRQYWKPVYCFLRRRGYDNEQAKDLTQGFFHEVVLGRELFNRACREKGSFRKFLLTALEHFLASSHRKESAQKRRPLGARIDWEEVDVIALDDSIEQLTAEESFDYAWLSSVLDRVLAATEADCRAQGLEKHWGIFQDRVLDPILNGTEPPPLPGVGAKYGVPDPATASNMMVTVSRRLQKLLRRHFRECLSSDAMVDEEVRTFLRVFSQKSAG